MITKDEILSRLTNIVRDVFDRDDIVLTSETTADDVPDWDSVNHINVIVAAEMRFGIKFQAAETEEMRDVGGFIELIASKLPR
jgi:acyl carrier protein